MSGAERDARAAGLSHHATGACYLGIGLGSESLGYTLLFIAFALCATLGTVTVRYIKGAT